MPEHGEAIKGEAIKEALRRFRPRDWEPEQWAFARDVAVAAVLAASPVDAGRGTCLLSRLCTFLAASPSWDRASTPDLGVLLTGAAIDAYAAQRLRHGARQSVAVYRADLRRIARAIGTMPTAMPSDRRRICAPGCAFWPKVVGDGPFTALVYAYEQGATRFEGKSWDGAGNLSTDLAALLGEPTIAPARGRTTIATVREGAARLREAPDVPAIKVEATDRPLPGASDRQPVHRSGGSTSPTRAARAARAAYRAGQAQMADAPSPPTLAEVPPLDQKLEAAVSAWRPRKIEPRRWAQVEDTARLCIRAYRPPSRGWISTQAGYLARFCVWAATRPERDRGEAALDPAELLGDPHLVERFLAEQMADQPGASRSTARSVLRRALQHLSPAPGPQRFPHQPLKPPYTPAECAAFVRLARNQPTIGRKRALGAVVALGLGAGLDGKEQGRITPRCVVEVDLGDEGLALCVQVPGSRARLVVVREDYEGLLREVLALHEKERRGKDHPLYGTDPSRHNVTGPPLHHAVTATGAGVEVDAARLRSTWLAACMAAPVPLGALLHASGLRTARTLIDLLPYCPEPDSAEVARILRRVEGLGADAGTSSTPREDAP